MSILIPLFWLSFAQASPSPTPSPAALDPQLLAQGDSAFKERKDPAKAREALEAYRKLHASAPDHPDAGWRLAMATYFVGLRLTSEEDAREKLFAEGRDAGQRATRKDPRCAACQFWTAINMALYGQTVGVFKMIFTLNEIQERLKKSSEADPAYAGAGAFRLLGTIQWKLPGILGGSDKRAREYFEKAIELAPDEPLNYLFLARLLKAEFDDAATATLVAKKGVAIDPARLERLESHEALQDLREFIGQGR